MSTFTKLKLSGSTDGKQIKIVATGTPGTTIHTAVVGVSDYDEIWLWATNNHTSAVNLTIEFGGVASPDDLIQLSVPSKSGLYLVIPGWVLQNSQVVKAFAATANVICIGGFVNRVSA